MMGGQMLYYNPQEPLAGALAVPQRGYIEPISEEDYQALITSSNQDLAPAQNRPNWEQFVGQLLSDPDLNQVLAAALATAPAAAMGLPNEWTYF